MFRDEPRPRRKNFGAAIKRAALIKSKGKCMNCRQPLDARATEYDHKDNNSANNSEDNCFVVCSNCHRKHTVITKRAVKGWFGDVVGYKTIKRKVGYKKATTPQPKSEAQVKKAPTKKSTPRKRRKNMLEDLFGL